MKVLLVKTSSLGDVVHALPAVTDAIAQGFETVSYTHLTLPTKRIV